MHDVEYVRDGHLMAVHVSSARGSDWAMPVGPEHDSKFNTSGRMHRVYLTLLVAALCAPLWR